MIKVEHTKTHPTDKATIGGIVGWVLVTDAELVLVEYMTAALPNCIIDTTNVCIDGKCYKPILISRTEKIEVGDWFINSTTKQISQCTSKEFNDFIHSRDKGNEVVNVINASKILALPEHFSPEQLQLIVDGKLKEGKLMLECEYYLNYNKSCSCEGGVRTKNGATGTTCRKCNPKDLYRIKLNPHITIYPVEEKMYTREEVIQLLDKCFGYCIANSTGINSNLDVKKWFEQNVK